MGKHTACLSHALLPTSLPPFSSNLLFRASTLTNWLHEVTTHHLGGCHAHAQRQFRSSHVTRSPATAGNSHREIGVRMRVVVHLRRFCDRKLTLVGGASRLPWEIPISHRRPNAMSADSSPSRGLLSQMQKCPNCALKLPNCPCGLHAMRYGNRRLVQRGELERLSCACFHVCTSNFSEKCAVIFLN